MPIRWKVVSQNRESCMVGWCRKYCLKYKRGTVVKGVKGTLGVMVFKSEKQAEGFLGPYNGQTVIKVNGIGRGKVPAVLSSIIDITTIDHFYKHPEDITMHRNVPDGTICYKSVEVLT